MVYDHLNTVVDAILTGKDRQFNRRFLTLANHDLFEPVACTPESGCFADEPSLLRAVTAPFDSDVEQTLRVSSTCLIGVDRNR